MEWIIGPKEADIILTTYQRSGSHFLLYCVGQLADVKIHKTHEQVSADIPIFSIVRNPFDSIASHAAMSIHFKDDSIQDINLEGFVESYKSFYEYLRTVDYIFSYDQVISDPTPIIHKIAEITNVPIKSDGALFALDYIKNDIKSTMEVASSRALPSYQEMVKRLSSVDLSECVSLYEEALARAIEK
jgi:hypothetical protein